MFAILQFLADRGSAVDPLPVRMEPGHIVSQRYEIKGVLGRGGMGEVYLAHDHRLAMDVALKRVPLELSLEPQVRAALISEAQILAKLSHANIVRLFDLADTADGLFMILEYVCGPSLDKVLLQRKKLSLEELNHVMGHVALGLTRAHSLGVIHRDLKPANLLAALSGEQQRYFLRDGVLPASLLETEIKVTDFGLAKVIQQTRVEASGHISGTPAYMAPEQFRGELPSIETDIYSLGLVAYACLTGKPPLEGADPLYFHLYVTPPPLTEVPAHVNAAIQKAIRKERAGRFHSVVDFASALRRPPAPPPTKPVVPVPQPVSDTPAKLWHWRKGSRSPLMALWFAGAILLAAASLIFQRPAGDGARKTSRKTSGSVTTSSKLPALLPLPPLNPAPRIDVPPPPIEQFRLTKTSYPLPSGIAQPELLGQLRITGHRVFGFGPDGTLYVTSDQSDIGAIRNGQLIWQYKLGADSARFHVSPDGLIWIHVRASVEQLFCFNAAGQGGEFVDPALMQKYLPLMASLEQSGDSAQCLDAAGGRRDTVVELQAGVGRSRWKTPLDYRCAHDPMVGRSGNVLVQTEARTVYLLSHTGSILWTHSPACLFDDLMLLSNDVAIGKCRQPASLIGIRDGQQVFAIRSSDSLSELFAEDKQNNFYRLADTEYVSRHFLIKTDSAGHDVWKFPYDSPIEPDAAMGPDGKIYLLSGSPEGAFGVVIGEQDR